MSLKTGSLGYSMENDSSISFQKKNKAFTYVIIIY